MSARRYPVVIEQTATGYSAYSPDVPGCVAVGDTEDQTRRSAFPDNVHHIHFRYGLFTVRPVYLYF